MLATGPQTWESVLRAWRPPTAGQSPRREPHQEGVTETSVSVEMGASKTVPPASTKGRNLFPPRLKHLGSLGAEGLSELHVTAFLVELMCDPLAKLFRQ